MQLKTPAGPAGKWKGCLNHLIPYCVNNYFMETGSRIQLFRGKIGTKLKLESFYKEKTLQWTACAVLTPAKAVQNCSARCHHLSVAKAWWQLHVYANKAGPDVWIPATTVNSACPFCSEILNGFSPLKLGGICGVVELTGERISCGNCIRGWMVVRVGWFGSRLQKAQVPRASCLSLFIHHSKLLLQLNHPQAGVCYACRGFSQPL